MLADLDDAGFWLIPMITDRGYESIANIEKLIARGQPFISAVKTSTKMVYDRILELGDFCVRPESMTLDRENGIYAKQFDIENPVTASNGRRVDSDKLRDSLYYENLDDKVFWSVPPGIDKYPEANRILSTAQIADAKDESNC